MDSRILINQQLGGFSRPLTTDLKMTTTTEHIDNALKLLKSLNKSLKMHNKLGNEKIAQTIKEHIAIIANDMAIVANR